jgi:hypothetical protein
MAQADPETIALGDFEIARVNDNAHWWDGGAVFGVVPRSLWSRKAESDELNRVRLAFNCYLVRTGAHNILIETGLGDKRDARTRGFMNVPAVTESMPEALARRGVDPESIDIVVNSHRIGTTPGATRLCAAAASSRPFRGPATSLPTASGNTCK